MFLVSVIDVKVRHVLSAPVFPTPDILGGIGAALADGVVDGVTLALAGGFGAGERAMPSKTPLERAAPTPTRRAYNIDEVGKTRKDSLRILNLSEDVTEREVKTNNREIARIYHPDKHRPDSTGMSPNQAEEYFKLVNNVYEFLRSNV